MTAWQGFTLKELKDACTVAQLRKAGKEARELHRVCGFTIEKLREGGFGVTELKKSGFGVAELRKGGFAAESLRVNGFGVAEVLEGGFTIPQLRQAGYVAGAMREAGLSVLPNDSAARAQLGVDLEEALEYAYAPNTVKRDLGHFRDWTAVCTTLGTSPWRTDMAANSGADPEGYSDEVYLMCTALISMYDEMRPRSHSDPAADPRSCVKKLQAVRRMHRKRWPPIEMVPISVVSNVTKGMLRESRRSGEQGGEASE